MLPFYTVSFPLVKRLLLLFLITVITIHSVAQSLPATIKSPGKKIEVTCITTAAGEPVYTIRYSGNTVLETSKLGIKREDEDFSKGLTLVSYSANKTVTDHYRIFNAKRFNNSYTANERVAHFKNETGRLMDIIFRVSNDGVAFRYFFPEQSSDIKKIEVELTSFHFPAGSSAWLQPMSKAKTGWQQVNPCYEEFYEKGIPVGTPSTLQAGWVFPALFQSNNTWLLLTESGMDGTYCGSKLDHIAEGNEYHIAFPDPREIFPGGPDNPQSKLPWYSPWRIITIGSLATIIESTLGTDLAAPASQNQDYSFAKPGKASWSWPLLKDDSITYDVQKRFIDYAADMQWQSCLIDVNWDTKIGYDSIQLLIDYAKQKNVAIWLWYNSAGSWNTTPYHPRSKLLTHADRVSEFSRLQKMGVAGVKIDFFGGDGQSMLQYYIDILKDAATYRLMVNFHGATLPRGWQRTYPNLLSAEAIKGFEYVTFEQKNADEEPAHCAMLPFTRNAFDPMDFTPLCLYKLPRIKLRTTPAFELALSVLFLSGAQHFAETPEGMSHMPGFIKDFLRALPTHWDDVKFIDGFPGKYVVLARKSGNKWYIAGINGTGESKTIQVTLDFTRAKKAVYLQNKPGPAFFDQQHISLSPGKKQTIQLAPGDGFVIITE
jgi:alpha-glucosidase